MIATWTWLAGIAAVLAAVLLATKPRTPAVRRIADLLLLVAAGGVLAGVAGGAAWRPEALARSAAHGAAQPPIEHMVASALLGLAALAALPSLLAMASSRPGLAVRTVLVGCLVALAAVTLAVFARLQYGPSLATLALAGLALGAALWLVLSPAGVPAFRARALLVAACALTAGAGALALSGAAATKVAFLEGDHHALLGQDVAYAGAHAAGADARVLDITVPDGHAHRTLHPVLRSGRAGRLEGHAAAAPFAGVVVTPLALRERAVSPHTIQWLARGESLEVSGVALRFQGFRMDMSQGMRVFADLDVEHAGIHATFSPGVKATPQGEEPFAVDVPGVGAISVAKIDADNGRVGLIVPGAAPPPARTEVLLDVRLRPMLRLAWAAVALAALALVWSFAAGSRPRSAAAV